MTVPALRLCALGPDPAWRAWSALAQTCGAEWTQWPPPKEKDEVTAVLVSAWDEPAPAAAARASALVRRRAQPWDVWVIGGPLPGPARARVLAAGAVGCLPRIAEPWALERVRRLSGYPLPKPLVDPAIRGYGGAAPRWAVADVVGVGDGAWWVWPQARGAGGMGLVVVCTVPRDAPWARWSAAAWVRLRGRGGCVLEWDARRAPLPVEGCGWPHLATALRRAGPHAASDVALVVTVPPLEDVSPGLFHWLASAEAVAVAVVAGGRRQVGVDAVHLIRRLKASGGAALCLWLDCGRG